MVHLRLFLAATLVCGSIVVGESTASAGSTLRVSGAGASSTSGFIVINARATAPLSGPFIPVAPAVGFIRAQGTFNGDFRGSVTCMASPGGGTALVSGILDTPFVSGGFTYPNFSLIVSVGGGQ